MHIEKKASCIALKNQRTRRHRVQNVYHIFSRQRCTNPSVKYFRSTTRHFARRSIYIYALGDATRCVCIAPSLQAERNSTKASSVSRPLRRSRCNNPPFGCLIYYIQRESSRVAVHLGVRARLSKARTHQSLYSAVVVWGPGKTRSLSLEFQRLRFDERALARECATLWCTPRQWRVCRSFADEYRQQSKCSLYVNFFFFFLFLYFSSLSRREDFFFFTSRLVAARNLARDARRVRG